ncbi:hypothetical protein P59_159 [Bacillus phage P59]|nr:hypothetical protein P59_159 [Bacillus phage P59]
MKIKAFKEYEASLLKVRNLLEDSSKKIQGVFYTNSYFTRRYLARSHALVDHVNLTGEDSIKLTVSARIEPMGLLEIENTLDTLVHFEAGDIPGFMPEGMLDEVNGEQQPLASDIVTTTKQLYNLDILLIMNSPKVTYQEFKIAGQSFTLVNIHHILDEDYEQTVTLLFGPAEGLYFFSNFFDKELSLRDSKIILDLIMDENITGKVIKGIKHETELGVNSFVFPYEELFSSYYNQDGDYIFGTGAGYIKIPKEAIDSYKMKLIPDGSKGNYQLVLENNKSKVRLYME